MFNLYVTVKNYLQEHYISLINSLQFYLTFTYLGLKSFVMRLLV